MKIHINSIRSKPGIKIKKIPLKNRVKKILRSLGLPEEVELSITFVDDRAMREFNEKYRGIKRTTDVLSFPQHVSPLLGDIIISTEAALKQSASFGHSLEDELDRLIIHGILHLLGYDHKKKQETLEMRRKEKELVSLIS